MLGRTFTPQEDSPNGGKVVVLSYGLCGNAVLEAIRTSSANPFRLGDMAMYTIWAVTGKSFVSDPEAEIWLPFRI